MKPRDPHAHFVKAPLRPRRRGLAHLAGRSSRRAGFLRAAGGVWLIALVDVLVALVSNQMELYQASGG
jgi:hypothetical protein